MNKQDIYQGELNADRIEAYMKLSTWNVDLSTIRDVFCAGAEWGFEKATIIAEKKIQELEGEIRINSETKL